MIQGLVRHLTDADIKRNFVDTHGQSLIAFDRVDGHVVWKENKLSLSRVVITTDAGIGKTTATHSLEYLLGTVGDLLAFRLTVSELCSVAGRVAGRPSGITFSEALLDVLAERFLERTGQKDQPPAVKSQVCFVHVVPREKSLEVNNVF